MREKQSWILDGIVVGSVAFLAAGAVWLSQPKNIVGMIMAGALGSSGVAAGTARLREQNSTKTLQRELRLLNEQSGKFSRRLAALEFERKTVVSAPDLDLNQQFQNVQTQIQNLQDQIKQLQVSQPKLSDKSLLDSVTIATSTDITPEAPLSVSEQFSATKPRPIKRLQQGEFGSKNIEKIKAWLQERGIVVMESPPHIYAVDWDYGQLANYLGENYAALKGLLVIMKRSLHHEDEKKRNQFRFYPSDESSFALCEHFCKKLKKSFLLSDYKSSARNKWLLGTLNAEAEGLKTFLDGKWFERFTHQKMTQLLMDKGLDHACLLNPKVRFPKSPNANELDTLFLVEETPICVECKSGGYALEDALSFASHCEKIGVFKQNALFVVLDVPSQEIDVQNRRVSSITITNIEKLEAHLEKALILLEQDGIEDPPDIVTPDKSATGQALPESRGLLSKVKYRPVRNDRLSIIAAMVDLFQQPEAPDSPRTFVTVKTALVKRTGISKSRINDVLQLLKHAGYFLDEAGETVSSIIQPIARLKSPDPAVAEQAFLDQYALNVLHLVDLEFFDSPKNRAHYEEVVGGKAPDDATLERLKVQLETPEDDLGEADLD